MRPAGSIILFTTASGAGYGLLALLGLLAALGLAPPGRWLGPTGLALALALVGAGLLSSAAHLGHPERAWRAFSQWRSSWLSREAVLSAATFVPAGLFFIGWALLGRADGWIAAAGLAAAIGAAATVVATGMIYASLKTVPQWHGPFTVPGYLLFAVATGAVLLDALLHLFGAASGAFTGFTAGAIAIAWAWKTASWRRDDAIGLPASAGSATGLAGGPIRTLEWPHTGQNYLLKEMGHEIARKHAARLRRLTHLMAFALPLGLTGLALAFGQDIPATLAAVAAVLIQAPGMLIERWLFFAEARHVVMLYYRP